MDIKTIASLIKELGWLWAILFLTISFVGGILSYFVARTLNNILNKGSQKRKRLKVKQYLIKAMRSAVRFVNKNNDTINDTISDVSFYVFLFLAFALILSSIYAIRKHFPEMNTSESLMLTLNVAVLFLMVVAILTSDQSSKKHIRVLEKTSHKQIRSQENILNIARKQLIKSLIKELQLNLTVYEQIVETAKNKDFKPRFNNFILTSTEKCLSETPIYIENINKNILTIYYIIRVHDNKIIETRIPSLTPDSLSSLIGAVANDYKNNKELVESTIKMLIEYEQSIKIQEQSQKE